jgi:glycosyltransferase involved in cell wall biosynthesis
VNQTLGNIEIILIDDGSPDGSGAICDEYSKRDTRIKVVHKENGGLSSARNVGLELSTGEYYIVCDSDDWVETTMYEELYNKAKQEDADIVLCDYLVNTMMVVALLASRTHIQHRSNILKT